MSQYSYIILTMKEGFNSGTKTSEQESFAI